MQRNQRHNRQEDRRRNIHPRGSLKHVHDNRDTVPRRGEAHEVVVVRLLPVVRVAEHRGDDDNHHHDDRDRLRAKRQVHRHEQGRQERPRQVVDEIVDDAAVEPGDHLTNADLAGQRAVDAIHDERDGEPQPHHRNIVLEHREERERRPRESGDSERVHRPRGDHTGQAGFADTLRRGRGLLSCSSLLSCSGDVLLRHRQLLLWRIFSAPQYAKDWSAFTRTSTIWHGFGALSQVVSHLSHPPQLRLMTLRIVPGQSLMKSCLFLRARGVFLPPRLRAPESDRWWPRPFNAHVGPLIRTLTR